MVQVRHKVFRSYSGPIIYGKKVEPETHTENHAQRAIIITEGVETGYRVGSIMAADGTAMTAGRGQHILVYPRELANEDFNAKDDQGGLGQLLYKIEKEAWHHAAKAHGPTPFDDLFNAFNQEGWYLAGDGLFRWLEDGRAKVKGRWMDHEAGDIIHGAVLRDTITPVGGKVPKTGEQWQQARRWALLFHEVFAHQETTQIQFDFEVDHLVDRVSLRKYGFHPNQRKETVSQVVYGSRGFRGPAPIGKLKVGKHITEELDLAMCVFHSHTVNAPSIAFRKLKETLEATGFRPMAGNTQAEIAFARELLKRLAKAKYGRWNEDIEGGRWDRTRARARESGMWPTRFFRGQSPIMPVNF